jgi:hypothetical protein
VTHIARPPFRNPIENKSRTLLAGEVLKHGLGGRGMAIVGITRQGLAGMAISVALLWGCLLGERLIVRQASVEQARALRTMQSLRDRQSQPVSTPIRIPRPLRPTVG